MGHSVGLGVQWTGEPACPSGDLNLGRGCIASTTMARCELSHTWGHRCAGVLSQLSRQAHPCPVICVTAGSGAGSVSSFWKLPGRGGPGGTCMCWFGKKGGWGRAGLGEEVRRG